MVQELEKLAGTDCDLPLPRDARTGAVITVDSFVGRGAHWSYSTLRKAPCLPLAAILYWLADSLAGAERRTLQADPEAAQLAAQWQSGTVEMFFHPAVPAAAQLQTQPQTPPGPHLRPHQKLAEYSGRHGEHVKRLPLAGEPF